MISRYILKIRFRTALLVLTIITFCTVYVIQNYFIPTGNSRVDISKIPIIVWWTPFMLETKKLINCEGQFQCILTKNRTYRNHSNLAAYLFYGSNFDYHDLPLPKNHIPWAIFHEESPKNLAFFLHMDGQKLFNITSTFSRNSDFPIPLQFLRDLDLITDTNYYVPVSQKNMVLDKIAPILYIQSDCDTPSERDSIVRELMKYVNVDSYGVCLNNKELPEKYYFVGTFACLIMKMKSGKASTLTLLILFLTSNNYGRYNIERTLTDLYERDFMKFVAQYKFTIAIENSICNDYITEKLWRPLIAGSIPIYLGSPTIKDWLPNNNSAILIQDYKSIPDLANYINKVNGEDKLYEKHLLHKLEKKVTNMLLKSVLKSGFYGIKNNNDYPIPAFECFVCQSIYERSYRSHTKSVYDCEEPASRNKNKENWWKSHWQVSGCQAKTLYYFLEFLRLHNYTKEMFTERYMEYLNHNDC